MSALVSVVVGFLLTSVLGGALGLIFQERSWRHQHDIQLRDLERDRASQVFEEVSRLLDKRLYRLEQVYWHLQDDLRDVKMDDYREILYEWNDGINRILALTLQYFGNEMRHRLDYQIGHEFVDLGRGVERLWKTPSMSTDSSSSTLISTRLRTLHELVYTFNLDMLRPLQAGSVGLFTSTTDQSKRLDGRALP